jgi:hypothetical protein
MLKLKENNIATMHAEDEEKTHNKKAQQSAQGPSSLC